MPNRRAAGTLLLAAILGACAPGPTAPAFSQAPPTPSPAAVGTPTATTSVPTPVGSLDRVAGWQADIAAIIPGLERIHPDPYHGTSKADLQAAVDALVGEAPSLTDDQLLVGVSRIAALVSAKGCDAHTGVFMWGGGSYPLESLPLRLWLFGDDLVIVDALPPHEDLIGARIESIEGRPIADVRAALDPLIPRDNDQTVRLLTPRYLLIPQVLRGLGLPNDDSVRLRFALPDEPSREVDLASIPMADYNTWAGPYGLHLPPPPAHPDTSWLARTDRELWWEVLPGGRTVYVQLNRVDSPGSNVTELREQLAGAEVTTIVLDLRHNVGGEVRPLDTLVELFDAGVGEDPGKLFVLTGRNTFSAASMLAARLDARTEATFIGEPMGGCPTFYADPVELPLVHSGLSMTIASTLEVGVDANDTRQTIVPDVPVEITQEEWAAGDDPAMELLLVAAP